jgi:methionyl-tRNA synthetase
MKKCFYLTTTLPYINSTPHIGFAMEIVRADTIARLYRQLNYQVFFNTGTDEHGQKILLEALKRNLSPQDYCDLMAKEFKKLKQALNLSYTNFIRTTDPEHIKAAQNFWLRCLKNGDIYKAKYKIKYCIGCEMEKTDSDLVNNRCPLHPREEIQTIEEENYFFRFSRYQQALIDFYKNNPHFIKPSYRLDELIKFVKKGLKDFSISRLKAKMPWGIEVPNDKDHVMYVWFDALINYISTLGWPIKNQFKNFWPGIQIAGKDNLRQQGAIWQAMLFSANLPPTKQIFIEGFITVNGQKMSKSLGNVINPFELVDKYGTDPVRYYLLKEIPSFDDGDFSHQRMEEVYQSELANELGNLVSRLTTLGEKDHLVLPIKNNQSSLELELLKLKTSIDQFLFNKAIEIIWEKIKRMNKQTDQFAPWKKSPTERNSFLVTMIKQLNLIGKLLLSFMPETAEKIIKSTQGVIVKSPPLFPRLI